jgi:hypothetical protein
MNFKYYLRQLQENSNYKRFLKENPDAYLCSGFFTMDKEGSDNQQHLDFYIPSKKSMTSFQMEQEAKMNTVDLLPDKVPEPISLDFDIDFDDVEKQIYERMRTHGINSRIQKLIFSLQKLEDKDYLTGTVFISMFGLIKVNIEIKTNKIIDFEKKSFFDLVSVLKKGK